METVEVKNEQTENEYRSVVGPLISLAKRACSIRYAPDQDGVVQRVCWSDWVNLEPMSNSVVLRGRLTLSPDVRDIVGGKAESEPTDRAGLDIQAIDEASGESFGITTGAFYFQDNRAFYAADYECHYIAELGTKSWEEVRRYSSALRTALG
ncbi:MAG: hypothetical protein ACREF5_00380 [Candidatus Saccharimonadales bacterium]